MDALSAILLVPSLAFLVLWVIAWKRRELGSGVVDSDPGLVAFLREHKLASKHSQDTDYVFCTESGRPLHFRNLGKAFTKAADKAKLKQAEGARKLRFHDTADVRKHPHRGRLCLAYVAQQLGHSVGVLCSTYAGVINANAGAERGLAAIQKARANQS